MSTPSHPGSGLRQHLDTAQRAAAVAAVLGKFGFGTVLEQTGLERFLPSGLTGGDASEDRPLPVRGRLLLEELGSTYIKVGQILSTRPDLIPDDWIVELRKLQSNVPPAPWDGADGVRAVLDEEYGERLDEVFASIDEEAIAAASMGQVHRATLAGGAPVVLKILRPGIREQMAADLELMRLFAKLTRSRFESAGFDIEAVVDEFARQLDRETDLLVEARSTQRMHRDFEDREEITFPRVHMPHCTRSVLVLEEAKGTLLARIDHDALTDEQRERIVRNGADMVFTQCLKIGFFHADPHPGNIFVNDDESLCFIDCGMTGLIDPGTIDHLASIVHGALNGDLDRVVQTAIAIGDADPAIADDRTFRSDVWQFVDHFQGGSLESIRMGEVLNRFFAILRKYHMRCPADIVYLIKALTTIEGVAQSIAPEFDLVAHVKPYLEQLIRQRYSLSALRSRLEGTAVAYGDLIERFPAQVSGLLRSAQQNRLSLNLDHRGLDRVTSQLEHSSMNVAWSLVVSAVIVGAAVLVMADNLDGATSWLSIVALGALAIAVGIGGGWLLWGLVRAALKRRARRKRQERTR